MQQQKHKRFSSHIGFRRGDCANGTANVYLDIDTCHTQYLNHVHGGVIASLIDHCAGAAAMTIVAAGKGVVTADMHVNFLRPGVGPQLHAVARVAKNGRKLLVIQVEVFNPNGQMCGLGTLNYAVIDYKGNEDPIASYHFDLPTMDNA